MVRKRTGVCAVPSLLRITVTIVEDCMVFRNALCIWKTNKKPAIRQYCSLFLSSRLNTQKFVHLTHNYIPLVFNEMIKSNLEGLLTRPCKILLIMKQNKKH